MASSFVLVHSPLVGPQSWGAVGTALIRRGQRVHVADLTGSLALGPPYLPRMAEAVSTLATGAAILVGHSAAGPVLPALGQALGGAEGYVFVDARLPHPGRSWLDRAPLEQAEQLRGMEHAGWLPPWSTWWGANELAELLPDPGDRDRFAAGCPRLPMALFEEVYPEVPGWPDAPCAYLLLSDAYREWAEDARSYGWPVIELPSHHLGLLTNPDLIATSLLDLVAPGGAFASSPWIGSAGNPPGGHVGSTALS